MSPRLPDDVIIEILLKLPFRNIHRLKLVSKSWFSLITNDVLARLFESPNLCFYYTCYNIRRRFLSLAIPIENPILETKISRSLTFLPKNHAFPKLTIHDCCNGLVFCHSEYNLSENSCSYFVCNPFDKTYNHIPFKDPFYRLFMLDFDPLKSPHYKLVVVGWQALRKALDFHVYHSEKHRFGKAVKVPLRQLICIPPQRNHAALWNGCVYMYCGFALEYKVIRVDGVLGGSDRCISYKVIKFSKGGKNRTGSTYYKEPCGGETYMNTWRGKLRFVSIYGERIRVWVLRDNQDEVWTMEHDCTAGFFGHKNKPHIVGFHPVRNVILIMLKHMLFAYDLDQMSFQKLHEFENSNGSFLAGSVIPFSPCFVKEVLV